MFFWEGKNIGYIMQFFFGLSHVCFRKYYKKSQQIVLKKIYGSFDVFWQKVRFENGPTLHMLLIEYTNRLKMTKE